MGTDVCSSGMLSLPWHESGDEELTVLLWHTKFIVTSNNCTKSACLVLPRRLLVLESGTAGGIDILLGDGQPKHCYGPFHVGRGMPVGFDLRGDFTMPPPWARARAPCCRCLIGRKLRRWPSSLERPGIASGAEKLVHFRKWTIYAAPWASMLQAQFVSY